MRIGPALPERRVRKSIWKAFLAMSSKKVRIEKDSLGELEVPAEALWGAQTQRAVQNFPVSGEVMPRAFIRALGLIKWAAAGANAELGLLLSGPAVAVQNAALQVASGEFDAHFPVDVFQTGSGTSSNMNANEVIARLASTAERPLHPNDHVNMGQSSNDVIPTAIHIAAALQLTEALLPSLDALIAAINEKAGEFQSTVKTGRTHLMDAMPLTLGQELGAWSSQLQTNRERLNDALPRICRLAQGGTAVGTGINTHAKFGEKVAVLLSEQTGLEFAPAESAFAALAGQEAALELSGHLKTLAATLMKIANDLRWMSSGPLAGIGELQLPALQPGSSIMPGKVNPVIPEAVAMVAAQVIGNDSAVTIAAQSGNFQLNVMLPLIAKNLIQSIDISSNAMRLLAAKCIAGLAVNDERIRARLARNPIIVTALNPILGYELGAKIAKEAYATGRTVKEVALDLSDLTEEELDRLLDPLALTVGGIRH